MSDQKDLDQIATMRFRAAQLSTKEGKLEEALREMIWCLDEGMKNSSSLAGVRRSFLLGAMASLGSSHPPALQALHERRDKARLNLATAAGDRTDWLDFIAINRCLGEDSVTLAHYDQAKMAGEHVPPSRAIHGQLAEAGRYAEAAAAKTFEVFAMEFDHFARFMTAQSQVPAARHIGHLARISGKSVEVFAGAGDLASAQAVVAKMLKIDQSAETLETLRAHAAKVGHPELIPAI